MKAKILIQMMKEKKYQSLTCGEFAKIVEESGILDVPVIEDYMNKAVDSMIKQYPTHGKE